MKNDKLIDGISKIDDDLIEKYYITKEALKKEKAKKRSSQNLFIRIGSIAAVLVLCVSLIPMAIKFFKSETPPLPPIDTTATSLTDTTAPAQTTPNDGDRYAAESSVHVGRTQKGSKGIGTILFKGLYEDSATFIFNKTTYDNITFHIRGVKYFDPDNTSGERWVVEGSTLPDPEPTDGYIGIPLSVKLYVDGVQVYDLPTIPGEYEIKIVFRDFMEYCDTEITGISFDGFGEYFCFGNTWFHDPNNPSRWRYQ